MIGLSETCDFESVQVQLKTENAEDAIVSLSNKSRTLHTALGPRLFNLLSAPQKVETEFLRSTRKSGSVN